MEYPFLFKRMESVLRIESSSSTIRIFSIELSSAYLSGGPFVLQNPIYGYQVMDIPFSGVAPGSYVLKGVAVDTSSNYLGNVDRETLTVQ